MFLINIQGNKCATNLFIKYLVHYLIFGSFTEHLIEIVDMFTLSCDVVTTQRLTY